MTLAIRKFIDTANDSNISKALETIQGYREAFAKGSMSAEDFHKSTYEAITNIVNYLNQLDPNLNMTIEEFMKLAKISLDPTTQTVRTLADVIKEVTEYIDTFGKDVANVNKILDDHANSNEWNLKAIMELAQTYPELLSVCWCY
jgi:DNA anti-recombination protein RmuC